ncbi:MAG: CPBP family intramembrane glutamic endopeptidase [Planctomycetota bacterium]
MPPPFCKNRSGAWIAGAFIPVAFCAAAFGAEAPTPADAVEISPVAGAVSLFVVAVSGYSIYWVIQSLWQQGRVFPSSSAPRLRCGVLDVLIGAGAFFLLPQFAIAFLTPGGTGDMLTALNLGHLLSVLVVIRLIEKRGQRPERALGLVPEGVGARLGPGLAAFFAFLPVLVGVGFGWRVLLERVAGEEAASAQQEIVREFVETPDVFEAVGIALAAVVIAPIVEEIFFRGFLYGSLRRWVPPWVAAVTVGLVFGLLHPPIATLVPLSLLGAFLCLVYEKTGRLLVPIGMHLLFNLGSTVMLFYYRSAGVPG